jgi:hypothetical protein
MHDFRYAHKKDVANLKKNLSGNTKKLRIKKKTISNLFRYEGRKKSDSREVDLTGFNRVLFLDKKAKTLEVEGLTTFEDIADSTIPHGFLPLITPELKHITIGGAIVGIGVETNSFRFGFVHNSLLEAEVLLGNGKIVTCSPKINSDLFYGLPNSYGTLGYVLRAKIKLRKIKPFMTLRTEKFIDINKLLKSMLTAAKKRDTASIEALAYSKSDLYLTITKETDKPRNLKSIYGPTIFYKEISKPNEFALSARDFCFRYDPDWFWNVPGGSLLNLFRRLAPASIRNSRFYKKYGQPLYDKINYKSKNKFEALIQDWEVPWKDGAKLFNFFFETVDLNGNPIIFAPIKVPKSATLYPMKQNEPYLNLGCYCAIKRKKGQAPYYATKKLDEFCFKHQGIKMLYSSTFLSEKEFDKIYNGRAYKKLKQKYDSQCLLPTLFEKAVKAG